MTIDLGSLFEAPDLIGFDDEMKALARREKAMSIFGFPISDVRDGNDEFLHLITTSFESDLVVVLSAELCDLHVFVTSLEEMWRVNAFKMLYKSFDGKSWSEGAERMESTLLGYSSEAVDRWLKYRARIRCGWTGANLYLLASDAQRGALSRVRNRCFLPEVLSPIMIVFWEITGRVLRADAGALCDGMHIGRVSLSNKFMHSLRARSRADGSVMSSSLSPESSDVLNDSLESKIEFWDGIQWQ